MSALSKLPLEYTSYPLSDYAAGPATARGHGLYSGASRPGWRRCAALL